MNYLDEDATKEFIQRLPDLTASPPLVHLMMLAVRSRKAREILGQKVHDLVVEREIIRAIPDWRLRYFNSVYNLSVLQHNGRYEYKTLLIPPQAMGIFATLSPRNVASASAFLMKDNITLMYQNNEASQLELSKMNSRYFGALHSHKNRSTNFVTLDLDNDDKIMFKEILDKVSILPIFMVTETSRGYHIVLNITKPEDAKVFYGQNALMQQLGIAYANKGLEFQKDSQEPIPGTLYYKKGGVIHYVQLLR